MAALACLRRAVAGIALCLSMTSLAAEGQLPAEGTQTPAAGSSRAATDVPTYLFVESLPLGARVFLDGKDLEHPSPILLRDLAPGMHRIRFEKEGWYAKEIEIGFPRSEPLIVSLVQKSPLLYIEGTVARSGRNEDSSAAGREASAIRLASSPLELSAGRSGIEIAPVFPRQKILDGINFSLPLFLALTGILTVREIYAPRSSDFVISPELAASALIGAGLLGWDIDLQIRRFRYLEGGLPAEGSWRELSLAARLRFDTASETLRGGDFGSALVQFEALAAEYPDDPVMPRALYETARLRFLQGDASGAEKDFRALVEDYPTPELYDRAVKGLADCLVARGDRGGALEQLELLTYNGSGFSRGDIELFRQSF